MPLCCFVVLLNFFGDHLDDSMSPSRFCRLCVGELPDVWKYLMENVYGPHSIHAIKGNLQLCRGRRGKKLVSHQWRKQAGFILAVNDILATIITLEINVLNLVVSGDHKFYQFIGYAILLIVVWSFDISL